jgi:AraC family transcriptional regulator
MDIFDDWLPRSGCEVAAAPSFECYSEAFDPIAIGNVEIWIAVKE